MSYMPQQPYANPNTGAQYYSYSNPKYSDYKSTDVESGSEMYKESFDLQLRLGFIRKVYGILSAQLVLTFFMCLLAMSTSFGTFQKQNPGLMILSMILSIVTLFTLMCFPTYLKQVPTNYIILSVFTVCEGYMVSALCSVTNPKVVFMAASMTCFMTLALTIYACTTKTDFTVFNSLLFIASCVLLLFGIFQFFIKSNTLHLIICCFGVFLYSLYLVYDTQLIIGNKENKLDYDDYIMGALMLYLDIINLFIYLLEILKEFNRD